MFKSVLDEGIMGNFYASVTGTSVIQARHRPASWRGHRHWGIGAYNDKAQAVRGRWRPRLVHL